MKRKIFSLLAIALLVFACSQEEQPELTPEQSNIIEIQKENATRGESGFRCDINWVAPTLWPNDPVVDEVIHIYWNPDPSVWDGGVIDIDCARQEYFQTFCGLYMSILQPTNPMQETWLRDKDAVECLTGQKSKDDVDTMSNNDDRVCNNPNCAD